MTERELFKIIHSELIQQVQCIEFDLKIIYSAMKNGNYSKNFEEVENLPLGKITKELKYLDFSDNYPDIDKNDYQTIEEIRKIRNYWCHQCYVDYLYIQDNYKREREFQEIFHRLRVDENRTYALSKKLEKIRLDLVRKYRG